MPGPPVITLTPFSSAISTASFCAGCSCICSVCSNVLSSCSIYVSKFYDFINFVNEYKGVNLDGANNIDDIVQEVIARE